MATESIQIAASSDRVMEVLRDPHEAARWFPFEVELVDPPEGLISGGDAIRSRGEVAGQEVELELNIREVREDGVSLQACGPVICDIDSSVSSAGEGTELTVTVEISSGEGLSSTVMAEAAKPLAAPSLRRALESVRDRAEQ